MSDIRLKDIAEAAGVSTATVSRILRNDRTTSPNAARVMDAARRLNYVSGPRISQGGTTQHSTLGMMIAGMEHGATQDDFFAQVVAGASAEAERRDLNLLISPVPEPGTESGMVRRSKLDGLIVGGVPIADETLNELIESGLPLIWIGHYLQRSSSIYIAPDNVDGGRQVADHLLTLGHRDIVVLSGPEYVHTFRDRLHGARDVLQGAARWSLVSHAQFDERAGYEMVQALLERGRPSALLALTDWIAIGALRAVRERGLRVPEDISITGYSDLAAVEHLDPPLTTVHVPQRQLGALAVRMMHLYLKQELTEPVGMIVPVELRVRRSTARWMDIERG